MLLYVQIDGPALDRLLDGKRVRGSIGHVEGNMLQFTPYLYDPTPKRFVRLRHGRASVSDRFIRVNLHMDRREKTDFINSLYYDTGDAVDFIRRELQDEEEKK